MHPDADHNLHPAHGHGLHFLAGPRRQLPIFFSPRIPGKQCSQAEILRNIVLNASDARLQVRSHPRCTPGCGRTQAALQGSTGMGKLLFHLFSAEVGDLGVQHAAQ